MKSNMKKLMMAVAGVLVGAAVLYAQPPQGGRGPQGQERPEMKKPEVLSPEEKTARMAQDYNLTPEQEKAVLELNKQFDGKLDFQPEGFGPDKEMKDPRQMSDAERQAFFEKMQERMAEMEEKQQQIQKDQKEYDKALKQILDKEQFKAYRKDQKKRERQMQERMGGPRGFGGPGGPGGPGGGFGGGFEMGDL